MTITPVAPVVATTPRLLLLGGAALVVGAFLELVPGLVASLLPQSPLGYIAFIPPVVLAIAAVLLALGGIGGRSALARIGLFVYAGAYVILLIASIAAMTGNVIELLFPLGGTLLTFGMLVAGIEVARVGAVGGFARWACCSSVCGCCSSTSRRSRVSTSPRLRTRTGRASPAHWYRSRCWRPKASPSSCTYAPSAVTAIR